MDFPTMQYENCHSGASQISFHSDTAVEFLYGHTRQWRGQDRGIVSLLSRRVSYAGDGVEHGVEVRSQFRSFRVLGEQKT